MNKKDQVASFSGRDAKTPEDIVRRGFYVFYGSVLELGERVDQRECAFSGGAQGCRTI